MAPKLYQNENLQSEKGKKLVGKLKQLNIVQKDRTVELVIGSTVLWGLNPCLVFTEKEIVVFNNATGKLIVKKPVYPYNSITGYTVEHSMLSRLCLFMGGVTPVLVDFPLNQTWCDVITNFLDTKINKR